jgi:transposase-like protein
MKSNQSDQNKAATSRPRRKRTPAPQYTAEQKAHAILAVWTERARPAEVCRQLSINWVTFSHWQHRAMEGMLQALESRVNLASGEALNPRLQALLTKRHHAASAARLSTRLERLQQLAKPRPPETNNSP